MAFHLHWTELCMFECDLAELHHPSWQSWRHLLSALAYAKLSLPFGSCQTVDSDFGSALVGNLWTLWGWLKCSCCHMTISLLLPKTSVKIPCYELEVAFVTGVCWCQHHFNVSVTQRFWRLRSSFFFSCAVHMDLMLAWSHLQVSTLYARSQLPSGIIVVAK